MKLTGQERAHIAAAMALAVGTVARYKGPPRFGYEAFGWRLDKDSVLHSPEIDQRELGTVRLVLIALQDAGTHAEGNMTVEIDGLDAEHANRLSTVLISKASLLHRAFHFGEGSAFSVAQGAARLSFFEASLDADAVCAYLLFAMKVVSFAQQLTRVTARERDTSNLRYTFRCFLLRLGFIGDEYKQARKLLLQNLDGDASWPTVRPSARSTQCAADDCNTHKTRPE